MILLRLISWPYLRKHLLRSVLTTAGIALGVALLVGMHTANDSVLLAFSDTVDRIAGKAQLTVSAGDAGFNEEVLERVQSVTEVRAAAPVIEAEVETGHQRTGQALHRRGGYDRRPEPARLRSGQRRRDAIDDPLVFLAQPDSLILTSAFAARNGISVGSRISFETMEGPRQFTVRGLLKAGGWPRRSAATSGSWTSTRPSMHSAGAAGSTASISRLREGATLEQGEAAIQKVVGPGFTVEPPSGRTRDFASLLSVYSLALKMSSGFALLIGMFIIYNSFAIAVTQRRSEIGILRALGATREQIRTLFLAESAVAGLIGSSIGVAIGVMFARSLTGVTGEIMTAMFGARQNAQEAIIDPRLLLLAIGLGVATSMLAAYVPARNAARVEPVQALQKGRYQILTTGESRTRRRAAGLFIAISLVCLGFGKYRSVFFLGYALAMLSALLLVPVLSQLLVKVLRRTLEMAAAGGGIAGGRQPAAGAEAHFRHGRRAGALAGPGDRTGRSCARQLSIGGRMGQQHAQSRSVRVHVAELRLTRFPLSRLHGERTRAGAGDRGGPGGPFGPHAVPNLPVLLVAVDEAKVNRRVKRHIVAGDLQTMTRLASEGKGFILAENLAGMAKLGMGDMIELPTPTGMLKLPVVGIIRDLSNQLGTIFIDRANTSGFSRMTAWISSAFICGRASPAKTAGAPSWSGSGTSATCWCS